jgi:PKD repeat protein
MNKQFKKLQFESWHFVKLFFLMAFLLYANYNIAQVQPPTALNDPTSEPSTDFKCSHEARGRSKRIVIPNPNLTKKGNIRTLIGSTCLTGEDLALKPPSELVDYLKTTTDYNCLSGVFFSPFIASLYKKANVEAVITAIAKAEGSYDGTNANGYYGLLTYLHSAVYHDFYDDTNIIDAGIEASIASVTDIICRNPNLLGLKEVDASKDAVNTYPKVDVLNIQSSNILEEFLIILIDLKSTRTRPESLKLLKTMLNNMTVDKNKTWNKTADINMNWYKGYWRSFLLYQRIVNEETEFTSNPGNLNELTELTTLLGNVALDTELKNTAAISIGRKSGILNNWIRNSLIELKFAVAVPQLSDKSCGFLAQVLTLYPRLHIHWINAIVPIIDAGKSAQFNLGKDSSVMAIKSELVGVLFPNTHSYNDGKISFQGKLSKAAADRLYYATRQVQSQFFRMAQTDLPVTGDDNANLTATIFESREKYDDYATFLYEIPTNNGGMYIEIDGHFYTWDRPATYSLSLEDLFRHEFTHYLQDRYLIPGLWGGDNEFYKNSRLVWYEEGNADFMVGATDFDGIKLKKSTVDGVVRDAPNWPTLKMVLSSSYDNPVPIHYVYGNLLWYMWYKTDFAKIKTFHDYTIKNDIVNFDKLVTSLKNNPTAEAQWVSFLNSVKNGSIQPWQPTTNWLDDQYLTVGQTTDITNELKALTGITATTVLEANGTIKRFKITGTIRGTGRVTTNANAALAVNTALDKMMNQLKKSPYIRNFHYSTAYYKNVTFPAGVPTASYTIIGSLRNPSVSDVPVADFTSTTKVAMVNMPVTYESLSKGYIKGYSWTVAGQTTKDTSLNPNLVFTKGGDYQVSLSLKDKNGLFTSPKTQTIKVYEPSNLSYCPAANTHDKLYQGGISRVSIRNINNVSLRDSSGYENFTRKVVTEVEAGIATPISIDAQYLNAPDIKLGVWIDLNQNGSFTDAGEQFLSLPIAQSALATLPPITSSFTIPKTARNGITRMRVRLSYGVNLEPCGVTAALGEVEDYTIFITNGSSGPVIVENPLVAACAASHGYNYSWISQVKLNTIDVNIPSNTAFTKGYVDLTATQRTNLILGATYPINVNLSYTNAPYMRIAVWLDLNQNGSFTDAGEQLLLEKVNQLTQLSAASITIPSNTTPGTKRMRIRAIYDDFYIPLVPCGDNPYMGGVIDCAVNVTSNETILTKSK